MIESFPTPQQPALANDALKTIIATMKRQPVTCSMANGFDEANITWSQWVGNVIEGVAELLASKNAIREIDEFEMMRLYRLFPRIVDANAETALALFQQYVRERLAHGDKSQEINQSIQLLKMTNAKVTRAILEDSIQRVATQG